MKATLPTPIKFKESPDSYCIVSKDGTSAHYSEMHDRLNIVDDETGYTIVSLRLNGMNAETIALKYVY